MAAVNDYPINANGGDTLRISLDAPPMGQILKAMVIQFTGSMDGFTFTFYNAACGCPPGINNDADVQPWDEAKCQVSAPRIATNKGTIKDRYTLADGSDGSFAPAGYYQNCDGGHSTAARKLYMKLQVPGSGPKVFGVFLGIEIWKG